MPFIPRSTPPPQRTRASALSVGRRVYVNCRGRVALTEDDGRVSATSLADGVEVEIVAWRPGGAGTRYRVRASEGHEGWLAADALRQTAVAGAAEPAVAAKPPAAPARFARDTHRKFGQR
jgi:hypothetical protein